MSENQKTNFEMVREFMDGFGQEAKTKPEWPDTKTLDLRVSLIEEEVGELVSAIYVDDNASLSHIAKELTDILYVVYGAGHAFGIDLDKCFAEVHKSNMTKFGPDGKVIRNESGKIMKSNYYVPADIKKVLDL